MNWYEIAKQNIQHPQVNNFVEMDVQRLIIEPLLQWLGYNTFDFNVVQEQTRISHSGKNAGKGRADYTIYHKNEPVMIIEAKMMSESLNDGDKIKQVLDYCNYHPKKPRWGILTNGQHWHIYDNEASGEAPERCILQIDVTTPNHILCCLRAENLEDLAGYADDIKNLKDVPEPTKTTLVSLLSTKFCANVTTSNHQVAKTIPTSTNTKKDTPKRNRVIAKYDQKPESGTKPTKLHVNGKTVAVKHWSEILVHTAKYILKNCTNSTKFDSWAPGSGQVRVTVNRNDLRHPKPIGARHFIEANISATDVIRTLNAMIDTAKLPKDCYWVE